MAVQNKVSLPVIKRLPKYYRYLTNLSADGKDKISSSELAHMMGTTASQVRQDFNCFGGFGQQGYGYNVRYLYSEIGKILGLDRVHNMIFVGAGNLATRLSLAMQRVGMQIAQVYSHTEESARQLAVQLGCPWTNDLSALQEDADLYVFSSLYLYHHLLYYFRYYLYL